MYERIFIHKNVKIASFCGNGPVLEYCPKKRKILLKGCWFRLLLSPGKLCKISLNLRESKRSI